MLNKDVLLKDRKKYMAFLCSFDIFAGVYKTTVYYPPGGVVKKMIFGGDWIKKMIFGVLVRAVFLKKYALFA